MEISSEVINKLKSMYEESGDERGGYITSDNLVFEVKNNHPSSDNNFMFSCEDLDKLDSENVIATFHTHPNKSSNLSREDYDAFVNWEKLLHFIK